jgi:hypothetical protein
LRPSALVSVICIGLEACFVGDRCGRSRLENLGYG